MTGGVRDPDRVRGRGVGDCVLKISLIRIVCGNSNNSTCFSCKLFLYSDDVGYWIGDGRKSPNEDERIESKKKERKVPYKYNKIY